MGWRDDTEYGCGHKTGAGLIHAEEVIWSQLWSYFTPSEAQAGKST